MISQTLKQALLIAALPMLMLSCDKNDDDDDSVVDIAALKKDILTDAAVTVISTSYVDLATRATALQTAVDNLIATTNDANLNTAREAWKATRVTWEQSESWLFGPVATDDIDPRIDTWPVDFNDLNSQLSGGATFSDAYINSLSDDLKGFHPIEFLLWGQTGNKAAASLTTREKEYLVALTKNLVTLTTQAKTSWTSGGYANLVVTAGASGNLEYPTVQSANFALVDGMAGICDEVANGKMKDPFDTQDPSQEESPFAKNSIIDFTNNIAGIMMIYQGKFTQDGRGLEDLVRNYNRSLDSDIKNAHAAAIASLNAITVPFGQAISTQQAQVQTAMTRINELGGNNRHKAQRFRNTVWQLILLPL